MGDREAGAIEQVMSHADRLRIPLRRLVKQTRTVSTGNPVGFDFTMDKGKSRDLLLAIIDSGRFGYDTPDTLFGFFAGCVARHEGFKSSFREIGTGPSMHIQIGDETSNAHIDSVGIVPSKDAAGTNLYDFSKLKDHWDRDLRPELGPAKHFDFEVIRGPSEITGGPQFGFAISVRKNF